MLPPSIHSLGQALHTRYDLLRESVGVGPYEVQVERVRNLDQLFEALVAKGDEHADVIDERIPYWAELWPSSIALGRWLLAENWLKKGQRVVEIGCGLGLSGIVAGFTGAAVTLTDYQPEALELVRYNWWLNHGREPQVAVMDWRQPDPALQAEVVLAADVAYEARAFFPLMRSFDALLAPGGRVLLSEPGRKVAKDFFRALPLHGFRFRQHEQAVTYRDFTTPVQLYEIWREAEG